MKKAFKILGTILAVIFILLFAAWILLQTPGVQTFVARKVTASLEDKFNGRFEFSKIYLKPFNAIVLKDFAMLDDDPASTFSGETLDTIARARSLVATFSLKGLLKEEGIHLGRISVSDGYFALASDLRGSNIKRFFDSGKKEPKEKKESPGQIFDANKVQIENFRFRLLNLKTEVPPKEYGISWKDLDVTVHSLSGHDLSMADGYMTGTLDDLSVTEKSGYRILSLTGRTKVGHGKTIVQDFHLTDPWSDIRMDEYTMTYENTKSFSRYMSDVRMGGKITWSRVDFKSISYFAPTLRDRELRFFLKGADVDGPVEDLSISRFEFSEESSAVHGNLNGRITGLPKIEETLLDFDAGNLAFTSEGLGKFIRGFAPASKVDLSRFAPGEEINFKGRVKGKLQDLSVRGTVGSGTLGSLDADLRMDDLIRKGASKKFSGRIDTESLDLGKILGIDKLGEVTLRGRMEASLGNGRTDLRIDTLRIDSFKALNYEYSDIMAVGTYSDKAFDGRLVSHDPNLNFLFQGIFTFSDKTSNGLYKFYANIGYADLHALGFDKREVSRVSGRINANYMTTGSGDLIGDLDILDLNLENAQGPRDIGNIKVSSHSNNNVNRMNLSSSFADGSFIGSKPVTAFIKDLAELTLQKEMPVLSKNLTENWKSDTYDLRIDVHDARDILSFAMPGLYIADSTKIRVKVSEDAQVRASVKSPRLAKGKNFIRNLDFSFDNRDSSLNSTLSGSDMRLAGMIFKNEGITLYANDNHVGIGCTYDNEAEKTDKGEIYLSGEFERDPDGRLLIHGKTLPSSIWFDDAEWVVAPSSIELAGKDIRVDNLSASSGGQSLKIDGGFSSTGKDTLNVEMVKLNLALANRFLSKDYDIAGSATGHAMVTSPWKDNAGLVMSLLCDSVKVAGREVGTLRLGSSLDDSGKLHMIARNELGGRSTLNLRGDYFTADKGLDIQADFDGMELGYFSPMLTSLFSEMGGQLSGKVRIGGRTDALSLSGEDTVLDNAMLKVAFTGVTYHASGPVRISDSGVLFNGISLKDRYDGNGTLSGGILFDHLKDIRLDTRIRMNRMEVLNLDEHSGQAFYGNVFASGNASIKGPFNAIMMEINARTDKSGTFHIPIDNASKDASSNLLTFKEPEKVVFIDPYEEMINSMGIQKSKGQEFGVRLKVNANQNTEAYIEIDRTAGNVILGRGQGDLDIEVNPSRDIFLVNGDYRVTSGNFRFNAMDIAKRDFSLSEGSSVRFNGDIMDSDLDIEGIYSTKASVSTLIADTTSTSTRRTVNCGVGISGKLREPQLTFSIDVPDLDPTTKSRVETALNTEDKVQRQFISLLISGSFMPEEQSGVVNNTSMLYSNLAEIMAGQLNSILQRLQIPLDFGLNYQSSESGTNIFDVAVSTQLFNNRVLVNGNVGNREYRGSAQGDVVGDLDIEIKLDKPGQVRLSLFSHSADDYTSYLDNTQRNGVGIAYQKEFNNFKEFIRGLFTKRRTRERPLPAMRRTDSTRTRTRPEREVNRLLITEEDL